MNITHSLFISLFPFFNLVLFFIHFFLFFQLLQVARNHLSHFDLVEGSMIPNQTPRSFLVCWTISHANS